MPIRTLTLLFLASALAQAQSITIQNSGFENATLPINLGTGPFCNVIVGSTAVQTSGSMANWVVASTTQSAWAGAFDPNLGSDNWTSKWWTGNNLGYMNVNGLGTVSMSQILPNTLQNNVTYTLSCVVGRPIDAIGFNYALQLWAGSTMLASASNFLNIPNNSSSSDSVSYSTGANNPQAGQSLKIVIVEAGPVSGSTGAYFDDIALTESPSTATTVGAVISAGAFGGFTSVAPGSWIEIYGSNLAANTRSWGGSDFNGINAPTKLDGTSVSIGGQAAFVDYISPGQVNALVPSNVGTGTQQVTVSSPTGISSPFTVTVNATEPGLLAPSSFVLNGTSYVVALFTDGTYVLPVGAIAGINSRPAKAGESGRPLWCRIRAGDAQYPGGPGGRAVQYRLFRPADIHWRPDGRVAL